MPVVPAHTAPGPLIVQVGRALTVTVLLQIPGQPLRVTLRVRVKLPAAPTSTVTEGPVVDPMIIPFPLMSQEYVTRPPGGLTVEAYTATVESAHRLSGPLIVQVGLTFTETALLQLPETPFRVTSKCTVKLPAAPVSTITEGLIADPLIIPFPLIDQK